MKGYICFILHAHLPFVRHPEHENFHEEGWLYEAVVETYIPLVEMLNRLLEDGVKFSFTISLTPTLLAMLDDPLLQRRCAAHIDRLIELSDREVSRTSSEPHFNRLARMYHGRFLNAKRVLCDKYAGNLLQAFRSLRSAPGVEIMTSCATHGYLPLMEPNKQAVKAQIKVGVSSYERLFGSKPAGIWLPECGYNPGDDEFLKKEGIRYFIVDSHGILFGTPRPKHGVFRPCYCRSGVAAFGRDMETSKSVWSSVDGYPGDYSYRDFYRDIGYDLPLDYIRPYINPDGSRTYTGIKYHSITGKTDYKVPYDPETAMEKAAEHAGNFVFNREKQIEYLYSVMEGTKPVILSPYDAELFGHWWFEGVDWLSCVMRKACYDQKTFELITPVEFLTREPKHQVMTPSMSSWGYKGYNEMWLEGSNDWIYRHLHKAADRMVEAARQHPQAKAVTRRALNQMSRELLLAQSSDWAFIMKTGSHRDYATTRFKTHIAHFTELYNEVKAGHIDEVRLRQTEEKDGIFPDIDYRIYAE